MGVNKAWTCIRRSSFLPGLILIRDIEDQGQEYEISGRVGNQLVQRYLEVANEPVPRRYLERARHS